MDPRTTRAKVSGHDSRDVVTPLAGEAVDEEERGAQWVEPKQKPTPLPKLQLSALLYLQLAEPIAASVILPFITQLVEETGITGGDITKVGYYTGLIESLFFFAEATMILQWGRLSDRVGRRPILLTGVFGLGLSMVLFGLSRTFWGVVASRALAGALNGNTGVIKCMMSEITDESNIALGYSFMPIMWAVGNTIAPVFGGLLQHPYERFGGIFRLSAFWRDHPYFLPCIIATLYSLSAFTLAYFFLKETAPSVINRKSVAYQQHPTYDRSDIGRPDHETTSAPTERTPLKPSHTPPASPSIPLHKLLTPRVLLVILNYALLAISDIAFIVLLPLFLSTPIEAGGLGMSPSIIGACLAAFGLFNGVISLLFFAPLNRRFGTRNVLTYCDGAYVICYALFPVINTVALAEGGLGPGVWSVLMIQLVLGSLPCMAFSCVFVFLTSAAPTRSALGATNGLAQTTISIMRAIGPAGATALFAFSIQHNILGGGFVYVVLGVLSATATASSILLPAMPWPRAEG